MNSRTFFEPRSDDFWYYFEPPWRPYENMNAVSRIFRIKEEYENISSSIYDMEDLVEQFETDEIGNEELIRSGERLIFDLAKGLEVLIYNFPHLRNESWFSRFWQTTAKATWRAQEGRFQNNAKALVSRIQKILAFNPSSIHDGTLHKLNTFFERLGSEVYKPGFPDKYHNEIYEVRDLYCLGYYSTALFVLGRAIEKAITDLGEKRKIKTLSAFGEEKQWQESRFYSKKEALKEVERPTIEGKMLNQKQYFEISLLISYRNNVAHPEYEKIGLDEAKRKIDDALVLLEEVIDLISKIENIDESEISPVRGQTVN